MNHKHKALLVAAGVMVCVGTAWAGAHPDTPVQIFESAGSGVAYGGLGSTRNSASTTAFLGCWIDALPDIGDTGGCTANNGSITRSCHFGPEFQHVIPTLSNLTSTSHIVFAWDTTGMCNYLEVSESSMDGPKVWP